MSEHKVRIETGGNPESLSFRIKDVNSGQVIISFDLSAKQAYKAFQGGSMIVDAKITDSPERIGKRIIVKTVDYSRQELVGPDNREIYGAKLLPLAKAFAEADPQYAGFETYSPRLTNTNGVTVVMRRWVEDTRCGAYDSRDEEFRCELDAGHDGNHRDQYTEWGA